MKILILSDFNNCEGGAEIYRKFLKEKLETSGHEVEVFAKNKERTLRKKFFSIKDYRDLSKTVKEFEPDIVFVHAIGNNISPILMALPYQKDIPIVTKLSDVGTYRKNSVTEGKYLFVRFLWSRILRYCITSFTDFYLAQSSYMKRWIKEQFSPGENKLSLIRNPPLYQNATEVNFEKQRILFVGRLTPAKGADVMIKAFNKLDDEEAELVMAGPGNPNKCRDIVDQNKKDKVKFKGRINHEELKKEYKKAKIHVMPSTIPETFGLTILESFTQGTPVITTSIGAQKELIQSGDNGFTVEPGQPEKLAEKMELCLNYKDEKINEMDRKALDTAEEYSLDSHVRRIEGFFQEVASN